MDEHMMWTGNVRRLRREKPNTVLARGRGRRGKLQSENLPAYLKHYHRCDDVGQPYLHRKAQNGGALTRICEPPAASAGSSISNPRGPPQTHLALLPPHLQANLQTGFTWPFLPSHLQANLQTGLPGRSCPPTRRPTSKQAYLAVLALPLAGQPPNRLTWPFLPFQSQANAQAEAPLDSRAESTPSCLHHTKGGAGLP
eukprot:332646-Chlamydomonas_euryale.AAC.1